jgi:DNA-binding MarR family transcriptional regulator
MQNASDRSPSMTIDPDKVARDWTLNTGVGFLIRLIEARYESLYRDFTSQEKITPRQFGVLITLHQQGPLTLTNLAVRVTADRATVGEMVKRMSERKLVHRKNNGKDARSYEISLAPKGRVILLNLVGGAARLQDAFLAPVPPERRAEFIENLQAVAYGVAPGLKTNR